jgi:hypothetical protein
MGLTYFKRYRMQVDLTRTAHPQPQLPLGYGFAPWSPELLESYADTKYRSFRMELDSHVFPCLGDVDGCRRLMQEISLKEGFLSEATWLVAWHGSPGKPPEYCGTIQGIRDEHGWGSVQNVGTTPEHRGRGIGTCLVLQSLQGFRDAGLRRVCLEVTAQNTRAIRLYRRLGFRKVRTLYKAVEVVCS